MLVQCKENKIEIVTSTITLLEVLDLSQKPDAEIEFRQLFEFEIHKALDLDIVTAFKAREYRMYYREKNEKYPAMPDAIHLATAFLYGVDEMHTFDDGKKGNGQEKFSLLGHNGNIAGDPLSIVRPPIFTPAASPPPSPPSKPTTPDLFEKVVLRELEGVEIEPIQRKSAPKPELVAPQPENKPEPPKDQKK